MPLNYRPQPPQSAAKEGGSIFKAERCRPAHPELAANVANSNQQNVVRSFFDRDISDPFRPLCICGHDECVLAMMSWARNFPQGFLTSITVIGCRLLGLCSTSGRSFFFERRVFFGGKERRAGESIATANGWGQQVQERNG